MLSEEFEFSLSQYADGTLPEEERAAVEQRLAVDVEARAALEAYRRLDAAIRATAPPLPGIRWDRLAEHLCEAVADEADTKRIISIGWERRATAWAAAALVFLAVGVFAWQLTHQRDSNEIARTNEPARVAVVDITGPVAEAPAGPSVLQVSVGRPADIDPSVYADEGGVVVRRPLITLAAAGAENGGPIR